jgi:hypothetical protein
MNFSVVGDAALVFHATTHLLRCSTTIQTSGVDGVISMMDINTDGFSGQFN